MNEHDIVNEHDENKYTFNVWLQSLRWFKTNQNKIGDLNNDETKFPS